MFSCIGFTPTGNWDSFLLTIVQSMLRFIIVYIFKDIKSPLPCPPAYFITASWVCLVQFSISCSIVYLLSSFIPHQVISYIQLVFLFDLDVLGTIILLQSSNYFIRSAGSIPLFIYTSLSIHLLLDILCCFHNNLVTVSSAVMNIGVHVSF